MIGYVNDYASDKVPILKVALPSLEIEHEPPGLGPITSNKPETPAETPEPPPLTQEESELLDARAFNHRATGKTYRQIARKLKIPSSSAYKRVQREMKRRREEFAEDEADSRELIVALLDGALEAIARQAYEGDQKAFHRLLQYANTRVRLAKIENPKTPDKLIRKLNAAAQGLLEETKEMAQSAQTPSSAESHGFVSAEPFECDRDDGQDREQDCGQKCGQKCGQEPQTLVETPVAADEKIYAINVDSQLAGRTQSAQPDFPITSPDPAPLESAECERDREQDCEQKCGQEPQTLAETPVAADEKICAEHIGARNEKVNSCEASPHELPRSQYNNPAVGPADGNPRPSGGSLTNGAIRDESSAPQEGLRQYAAAFLQPTASSPPALFAAPPEPRYA